MCRNFLYLVVPDYMNMNEITEKSVLIEFLKSPSYNSGYSIMANKWYIQQETPEADQLCTCIDLLERKGLIIETKTNPTNYFLPVGGEGVKKAIEYFLEKDNGDLLSKVEQDAINYMIKNSRKGASEVDIPQCLRGYLFQECEMSAVPYELMSKIQDNISKYLFKNDFINFSHNSDLSFMFNTPKGDRLCKIETIQKYWDWEKQEKEDTKYKPQPSISLHIDNRKEDNRSYNNNAGNMAVDSTDGRQSLDLPEANIHLNTTQLTKNITTGAYTRNGKPKSWLSKNKGWLYPSILTVLIFILSMIAHVNGYL